jgi:hypothetical protein
MSEPPTDQELSRLIAEANERALGGRKERLRFLLSVEDARRLPIDALVKEYYEETRFCWFVGAFVATILMVEVTLEEILRSHYRRAGLSSLSSGKDVRWAYLLDLAQEAARDKLVTAEESRAIERIVRHFRNPFVHTREARPAEDAREAGELDLKSDWLTQLTKIVAPQLVFSDVQDEARDSVSFLASFLPTFSRREWGI